jgi:hypothetical protein
MATASGPPSPIAPASEPAVGSTDASPIESRVPAASAPPMPGGFPLHASMTSRDAGSGLTASWTSDALPPEIFDFYRDALEDAGFVIDLEGPGGGAAVIRFHAADGTEYQLSFTGSGPVTIDLGPPRP